MFGIHEYPLTSYLDKIRADYRAEGSDVSLIPFTYNTDYLPLSASQTLAVPNTTDDEGEFHILQTCQAVFTTAGAFQQFPNITALIFWDVSGRAAQDRPIHLVNLFGTGQRPHVWIRPMRIPIKSTWTTTLTNLDAANDLNVRLAFHGVKAIPSSFR